MIVDADESKHPLVHRLLDQIIAGKPLDVAVAVINPLWRLDVIPGEETAAAGARADVAEAGTPDNRRIQLLSVVLDARRERDQVVRGIEAKFLARTQRRGLEFEHQHPFAGSRIDAIAGVASHLVQRGVELPGDRLIVNAKRKRCSSVRGSADGTRSQALPAVAILFQPPMRDPAAPVCQARLSVAVSTTISRSAASPHNPAAAVTAGAGGSATGAGDGGGSSAAGDPHLARRRRVSVVAGGGGTNNVW